jgi:2Fe-2S ferredoxin
MPDAGTGRHGKYGPLSAAELKFKNQGKLKNTERLACQSYAIGDVVAEVPLACQLPHMKYTT